MNKKNKVKVEKSSEQNNNNENEMVDNPIEIPPDANGMRINSITREIEWTRRDSRINDELFWPPNLNDNNLDFKNHDEVKVTVLTINISNFRKRVLEAFPFIIDQINLNKNHREFVLKKSNLMLNEFLLRAESNEFTIQRHANPFNIAITIIYAVLISTANMPKIPAAVLERKFRLLKKLPSKKTYHEISRLYKKYFEALYPRLEFRFESGFRTIKDIISLYFIGLMKNSEMETSQLILLLKKYVLKYDCRCFPEGMTQERIGILNRMAVQHEEEFNKYFTDLATVIQGIIAYSQVPMKIKSHFVVRPLVDDLFERDINLLHGFTNFYYSVIEIYDFLREKFPDDFPKRFNRSLFEKYEKQEYVNIIGHRIKLYTIEYIYNGRYLIDGGGKCPNCYEEGLIINTDNVRSTSLEYHHETEKKEFEYSAIKMFQMYQKSRSNPRFLEKLITKMESEGVVLICRVHHQIEHSKYYNYFRHLINCKEIFTLPAQLIHILIRISVNYYHKTKNSSKEKKRFARDSIISFFKKRYIFEQIYGETCPTCREFNIKEHLPGFDFNHINGHHFHENPIILEEHRSYIKAASHLFYKNYTCSEIARALEFEIGGYICKNCHNVFDYSSIYLRLLNEIYKNKAQVDVILNDYNRVKKRFKILLYQTSIQEPLGKVKDDKGSTEKYLKAIYRISHIGHKITNNSLADFLGIRRHAVFQYLKYNQSFFRNFIDIKIGKGYGHESTEIFLTNQGKKYIELIYYFRDYFKNLQ